MRGTLANWGGHLTIGKKFLLSFSLITLLLILSLAAILTYLARVNSYVERHQRITVPAVITAATLQQTLFHMLEDLHHLLTTRPSTEQVPTLLHLQEKQSQVIAAINTYRTQHAARTHPVLFEMLSQHQHTDLADLEDQIMNEIDTGLVTLGGFQETITRQLHLTPPNKALLFHAGLQYEQTIQYLETATTALIDIHRKIDIEMKLEGDRLVHEARLIVLVLIIALGCLISFTYLSMQKSIAKPLQHLATTANRVAHDDLTIQFDPWPKHDEVGILATSLALMLTSLRAHATTLTRKTKELEAFTYSVAHDLKGPLREIEGFSSLLEKEFADSNNQELIHRIDVIRRSALRLTTMIDALLKYSRLEQQNLPQLHFNVMEMIHTLIQEQFGSVHFSTVKIEIDLPFFDLYGEPNSIRQALTNLLDNAMKFARPGIPLEIHVSGTTTATERLIWVQDNGIGFNPHDSTKIFGLFERLHQPTDYVGTGIGLAIVQMVMEKHGGRTWAESIPGIGSTFYMAFHEKTA